MYTPKKCRKHNEFKQVRVMTTRDLYEKLGERVPQVQKTGGIAVYNLSKVEALAAGADIVDAEMRAQVAREQAKQADQQQPDQQQPDPVVQPDAD